MAEEQLELKTSLAKAKEEERIYEQMNNEELLSSPTCVQTQRFPLFPVSSLLADDAMKDANITSLTTPGSVLTTTTTVMTSTTLSATTSHLDPASKPFQVSSCSTPAPGYQRPPQASPLSGYTMGQTRPHYASPMTACTPGSTASYFGTLVNTVTSGYGPHPYETPTSAHTLLCQASFENNPAVASSTRDQTLGIPQIPQYSYGFPGCSTNLFANSLPIKESTFQDIVNIQRKQTELSQVMVTQQARSLLPSSEPPMFYGNAMEFPAFMNAFESLYESKVEDPCERLYFLGQYTSGKAKEIINGCLQRKSEGSYYQEAKGLLKRQFGDPFKIANAHITKLSSW